jgi:uncharacterized membrane protein YccF (DUF307 family)
MTLLLNILWFIFGGFLAGLGWLLASLILAITVIGLPWDPAALRIATFSIAPFGKRIVDRADLYGSADLAEPERDFVLNVVWFVFAGWWLALGHLVIGVAQCVTLIGIPFGIQHFKLAAISFAPVGREVVLA